MQFRTEELLLIKFFAVGGMEGVRLGRFACQGSPFACEVVLFFFLFGNMDVCFTCVKCQ